MKLTLWLAASAACACGMTATITSHAQTDYGAMPPPVTQAPAPAPMAVASNDPQSRAQVRADLARARIDGTIPRFGNPDPYGPARSARNSPMVNAGR
ncbi:DUF4148 domain-containing protein [Candidatus Burkholderia verschuerenii]|uniref:DUF4148 domain-containing protein n=1 Tax=Candidatus Burkholderia verschuerenii TaxID=242163 RepID=UPI000AC1C453|nr:DUF4148 domain-containing protein [Candidatus Burkholderia verschuerenii]